MRTSRMVLAAAGIAAAAAVTGSAFTAGNDFSGVTTNVAGYGQATVTGATVTNIQYSPLTGDSTKLGEVRFVTSSDLTGKDAFLTLKSTGTNVLSDLQCSVDAGTSTITCTISSSHPLFTAFDTVGLTVTDNH